MRPPRPLDDGHHDDGQHVGAGVVATALDLEEGGGVVFEAELAGAQNREHGGRVGGAEHRADQETQGCRELEHVVAEKPGQSRGKGHAEGGEYAGFDHHRLSLFPPGAETAVEHDEYQGHGTDALGEIEVVEGNLHYAVGSEGHAQQDECQQHGDAYLVRDVVEHYAQDNDDGGHEQEQCKGHKQGC